MQPSRKVKVEENLGLTNEHVHIYMQNKLYMLLSKPFRIEYLVTQSNLSTLKTILKQDNLIPLSLPIIQK